MGDEFGSRDVVFPYKTLLSTPPPGSFPRDSTSVPGTISTAPLSLGIPPQSLTGDVTGWFPGRKANPTPLRLSYLDAKSLLAGFSHNFFAPDDFWSMDCHYGPQISVNK